MPASLLVCIAHYHTPERMKYLLAVLDAFAKEYESSHDIIVDTNVPFLGGTVSQGKNLTYVAHVSLEHPFHLTWQHRKHMRARIEDYDWFMYIEDDIYLPFENFVHYTNRFAERWPGYIPSFLRVEKYEGEEYAVDVTARQARPASNVCTLAQAYHGFWIMPQRELRETMGPNFTRVSDSREAAASYPMWELHKVPQIEIEDGQVSRKCFAYHLPNNYAPCPTSPHGKVKISEIFSEIGD